MDVPSGRVVGRALGGEGGAPLPSSKALGCPRCVPQVMKAAAHVRDGSFPAYLDNRKESAGQFKCVAKPGAPNPAGASSLLSDMPRAGKPINVTAVDVPAFMRRTFCKGDEIHLKMDIEVCACGARFGELSWNRGDGTLCSPYPPPPCISYALVQATIGVGTVLIWYLILLRYQT